MTNPDLAALSAAATQGELYAMGWGDGSTQMGMTNLFNDDTEVCLMECIPEADAQFIAALWNTYRTGNLVQIDREGMRERVAKAVTAALAAFDSDAKVADAAIAAILGGENVQ